MASDSNNMRPFDPSQLKVEVKNTTIGTLCDMLAHDMIDLQPNFQRHAHIWNDAKKSRFIESIILGLPIPSLYFYIDYNNKKWVVIDGLQRLCALKDFMVDNKLKLSGLNFLHDYKGHTYDVFPYFERLEMSMRYVTLNIISGEASKEAIYIIFQRLNSEGMALKPAEIRNALYCGKGMDFIKKIADDPEFLDVIDGAVSTNRMMHYDYVARFMAFYLKGYESYKENMNVFLGNALTEMNKEEMDFEELRHVFFSSLQVCVLLLGKDVFRSPIIADKKKSNPMSITLFETMMCSVARLTERQIQLLFSNRDVYISSYNALFVDKEWVKYLSQGTGKPASVTYRFEKMENLVKNIVL